MKGALPNKIRIQFRLKYITVSTYLCKWQAFGYFINTCGRKKINVRSVGIHDPIKTNRTMERNESNQCEWRFSPASLSQHMSRCVLSKHGASSLCPFFLCGDIHVNIENVTRIARFVSMRQDLWEPGSTALFPASLLVCLKPLGQTLWVTKCADAPGIFTHLPLFGNNPVFA